MKLQTTDPAPNLAALARRLFGTRRPLVVSHRGPVTYQAGPAGLCLQPGAGGLAGALCSLSYDLPLHWVACAMSPTDRLVARLGPQEPFPSHTLSLRLVCLPPTVYRLHYETFSNPLLWFVQHGLADRLRVQPGETIDEAWEGGYRQANEQVAAAVAADAARPEAAPVVFVHDYQLYLVPGLLRRRRPDLSIMHFVHIPWPEPAAWAILPAAIRRALLESLTCADVVGLQTPRDARHFLACCRAWLPNADLDEAAGLVRWRGRTTHVRAYPISVDVEALRFEASTPAFRAEQQYLQTLTGERTIARVDRLDPSKNLLRGFEAFDLLLRRCPTWRERVTFLSFLVPSRSTIAEYQDLAQRAFALVDEINARHGTPAWQPIRVLYDHNPRRALAGLSLADVVLVNPLADGMNLVAKEAIAVNQRDGVLVLSHQAGAFEELWSGCLGVDPLDVPSTADALDQALVMPRPERRARLGLLRAIVEQHDVGRWGWEQLADLERLGLVARRQPEGAPRAPWWLDCGSPPSAQAREAQVVRG